MTWLMCQYLLFQVTDPGTVEQVEVAGNVAQLELILLVCQVEQIEFLICSWATKEKTSILEPVKTNISTTPPEWTGINCHYFGEVLVYYLILSIFKEILDNNMDIYFSCLNIILSS